MTTLLPGPTSLPVSLPGSLPPCYRGPTWIISIKTSLTPYSGSDVEGVARTDRWQYVCSRLMAPRMPEIRSCPRGCQRRLLFHIFNVCASYSQWQEGVVSILWSFIFILIVSSPCCLLPWKKKGSVLEERNTKFKRMGKDFSSGVLLRKNRVGCR